jgi:hypothetical protein
MEKAKKERGKEEGDVLVPTLLVDVTAVETEAVGAIEVGEELRVAAGEGSSQTSISRLEELL